MPDRTQEEGRTPYTEHNFNYTPSVRIDDRYRTDIDWQRKLLWAIREGDPTFDIEARSGVKPPAAPIIQLTTGTAQRTPYGSNKPWQLSGEVTNFVPTAVYSAVTLTMGDRGDAEVTLNPDGTFTFETTGAPFANNLLEDIPVAATVTATIGKHTVASEPAQTTVPFEFYVDRPILSSGNPTPSEIEIGTNQDVTVIFEVFNNGPQKFESGRIDVIHEDDSKTSAPITEMTPDKSVVLANSMFAPGQNIIALWARSQYNGELSNFSAKNLETKVVGLERPPAPDVTVDSPAAIEEGDPSVEIEGQVAPVAGTSLKTAVIKLAGQSYECTKSGATNFKATVPTAALSVGDHAFTAEATLQGDLESRWVPQRAISR